MDRNQEQSHNLHPHQPGDNDDMVGHKNAENNDDSQSNERVHEDVFTRFLELPIELRIKIYRLALLDMKNAVRTLGLYYESNQHNAPIVVLTKQPQELSCALRRTSFEAEEIVGECCLPFMVRSVSDVGANIINMVTGHHQRPLISNPVGSRRFHQETTFFMDRITAVEVFTQLHVGNFDRQDFGWLRNILVDWRTFQRLLGGYYAFSQRPGEPFIVLPGLKKIFVGFIDRWNDVAMVEGSLDDVITELRVKVNPEGSISMPSRNISMHFVRSIFITVQEAVPEIRAIEAAGIEVVWCMIRTGVSRRPDIFEYSADLGY